VFDLDGKNLRVSGQALHVWLAITLPLTVLLLLLLPLASWYQTLRDRLRNLSITDYLRL